MMSEWLRLPVHVNVRGMRLPVTVAIPITKNKVGLLEWERERGKR